MKTIISITLMIILILVFSGIILLSAERQEKKECELWKVEAENIPGYFLTDWQVDQCNHYKINL